MRSAPERNGRTSRVEDRTCPVCGCKKMFGSRSQTGRGQYAFKCTKCGHMVK